MSIDIASIFKAIGPAASIIFAAWIFMGFLQTRYDAAVDRYRALIGQYRDGSHHEARRGNMRDSILVYKKRCEIMNAASMIGLVSAIILVLALIIGELAIALPAVALLKFVSIGATLLGLFLVVVATCVVLYESLIIHRQLETELLDVPDLAHGIGQESGRIGDETRVHPSVSHTPAGEDSPSAAQ